MSFSPRRWVFLTVLALLVLGGSAVPAADKLPDWSPAEFVDFPVRIELADRAALADLLATVPLAAFQREQIRYEGQTGRVIFTPRVSEAEAEGLIAAGVTFERLPDLDRAGRRAVEQMWATRTDKSVTEWTTYPTYAQVGTTLASLAAGYPTLCRTFSWGQSVQGRELWGLVVSADVFNTEAEPEVRLSSTMHGDEPPDMVMLLNLAAYLVENYGQPGYEDVTNLVDNYEIHIMPLHNPDGYVAGSRYNANGVDLNRNFNEPTGTQTPALENVNFMTHAHDHHFVISQNGHGGALVVNYPWDYTYDLTPDDAAIQLLSLEYSTWNLPMYTGDWTQGITNGAMWYVTNGCLQDWSYYVTGCIDVTVEVHDQKWPNANQLSDLWDDNRESLMHFVKAARYGVNGVVTDSGTGLPLAATVTVAGNSKVVATDPAHGDYYKLLSTGSYTLTFDAVGYESQAISGVSTTWGTPTVLNVALTPEAAPVPEVLVPVLRARPNPFNPLTRLEFNVSREGPVTLAIWNLQGRRVRDLVSDTFAPGLHEAVWDGRDAAGRPAASGTYFARMLTADGVTSVKLMLVK